MKGHEVPELVVVFVALLEDLADPRDEDRAALARLKRCAGRRVGECGGDILSLFYRLFQNEKVSGAMEGDTPEKKEAALRRVEESYFLVATLFPLAPTRPRKAAPPTEEGNPHAAAAPEDRVPVNLGAALRRLATAEKVNAEGVDRRLARLVDADGTALPYQLRQAVRMLAQNDVPINWRHLLADLLRWNEPGRPVQKRWTRSYFGLHREADPQPDAPDGTPNEALDEEKESPDVD